MRTGMLFFFLSIISLAKAQEIDVLHYIHEIKLNDQNDTIQVTSEIKFVIKNKTDFIQLDLAGINQGAKGMKVEDAYLSKEPRQPNATKLFKHENNKLYIPTLRFNKNDTVCAFIVYKGIPDDGLIISKNKFGDRTFFADNWPNRAHHWIACIDKPYDKASFEFSVITPVRYSVVSNGLKVEEWEDGKGWKLTHWREDIPLPTKVMVIGVAKFATKVYEDSPKGIPVSAWVYPQDSTKGFYDYAVTTNMLKFFSDYIGPYPYNKLANVQSKTIFGGMENASCIFYAESTVTGDRSSEDVFAHEIAHQWFGDMATEKSFAHLWLSEGFATYFTDIYFEHKYGREAFLKRIKKERSDAIAFAKSSTHPVVDTSSDLMSLLNANSYQKGAWVLHMLRNEVGDSTFHKIIQAYYNAYKGSNADTRDFEAIAEKVSEKELKPFFDQWLYQPGVPVLNISWQYKNGRVEILPYGTERKFSYELHTGLLFVYKNRNTEKRSITLHPNGHIVEVVPSKEKPLRIEIDPDTKLLFAGGNVVEKTSGH